MKESSQSSIEAQLGALHATAPPELRGRILQKLDLGDRYVVVDGPTSRLFVAFSNHGIGLVWGTGFFDDDPLRFEADYERRNGRPIARTDEIPKGLLDALRSGRGKGLKYDLRRLTEFERAVLKKALEIPRGEVRSYSWVAREVGSPNAVRAVGNALGNNPVPILIPCHRVVRSDGAIGNYALGSAMKVDLLSLEGVDTNELARLEQARVRYVGSDTTKIFCTPTCRNARRIRPEHRVEFPSEKAAKVAGYRPCRHCRPAAA